VSPPPLSRRAVVLRGVAIALVAVCVVAAVVVEWKQLPEIEWRLRPAWLAASLAALLAFQWMHIELWRSMLRVLGGPMEPWRGRAIWSTTLLARYVPTGVLMAVGRIALSEREGVPRRVALASVVYEVALTFTTALALSSYLLLTLDDLAGYPLRYAVLVVPLVGIAALHPRVFAPVAAVVLRRVGAEPLPTTLPFRAVLRYAAAFTLSFVVAGFGVYAMTAALYTIGTDGLPNVMASYALGFAAGVVAFVVPGALGAREAGVVIALGAVVPTAVAIAAAVVLRLVQMGVELLFAAVTPLIARRTASSTT